MKRQRTIKLLFVSLGSLESFDQQGIYTDLLKVFRDHGHSVYAIGVRERRSGLPTEYVESDGIHVLRVSAGNIQKTNLLEKGLSTLALKSHLVKAVNKHLPDVDFDLVLFATPPTTISGFIEAVKERTGAKAYLLLKDIFPQNSLDLGLLSKKGIKGLAYRYFKLTERKTYACCDWIGCMSPANVDYLLTHEPQIDPRIIEVNPNSLIPRDMSLSDRSSFKEKYSLPDGVPVFVYGGNLGRPQNVPFLIEALKVNEERRAGYFAIAGNGTDRPLLEKWFESEKPKFAKLLPCLPRDEYDAMLVACDAGIVLLDHRFTIPNFPSRMLAYLQAGLPIVVATDEVCDMGAIAERHGFGVAVESEDPVSFVSACARLAGLDMRAMGERGRGYFVENCNAERSYELIMEHFND